MRVAATAAVVALFVGCTSGDDPSHPPGLKETFGGNGGGGGAGGTPGGAGGEAGGEAGGGTGGQGGDGGVPEGGAGGDGGEGGVGGPPPDPQVGEHLRFFGAAHGAAGPIRSVSVDAAGNVWAANGTALLLLRPGAEAWESFTEADGLAPYKPIAVAGAGENEVYVGYEGLFPDGDPFDDPPDIAKSGDVDRIRLTAAGLQREHYDISSGPEPGYPNGRDVLRTCFRIVPVRSGPYAGDVWFGCNHGVAMYNQRFGIVQEHHHTAINRGVTLYSGDFKGLAVTPEGNVWMGGAHRSGLLRYGDEAGQFWARIDPELDVFPEGESNDPLADDWVEVMLLDGTNLWVGGFNNGLARFAEDGTARYWKRADGLPDDRVYDLAKDPDGSLWIAADVGLARLRNGAFADPIDSLDGLPGTIVAVFVDARSSPRRVIVGTSEGVGIYDGP